MTLQIGISLIYLIFSLWLCKYHKEKKGFTLNNKFILSLIGVFSFAFILRLFLGYQTVGFETDMNTFKSWGSLVNELGFKHVYSNNIFVDYPPGYLYVLWLLDEIRITFGLGFYDFGYTLIMKMPSIIADMVCGIIVYLLGRKRIGEINSLFISAAYLFCPAVLINSAVWGQADSFTAMLLLISVYLFYKDKIIPAAVIYGLGVICKPQMLIFAPLFLFGLIYRKKFLKLTLGVLSALAVILIVAAPFTENFDYTWLINKYISTIDFYSYYTINAYNFWGLIGFNWKALPLGGFPLTALNALGPVIAVILSGILLYKPKLKDDYFVNEKYRAVYFACPALLMFTVYVFAVKMHERYLFPALLFILLTYVFTSDKRFLLVFSGASFVHFLNVSYVLYLNNDYLSPVAFELLLISALHVIIFIYFVYVLYSVFKKGKIVKKINFSFLNLDKSEKRELLPSKKKKFDRVDVLLALIVTLFYSIFALNNVGSDKAVDSAWTPENGESVIIESEGVFDKLLYLPGIDVNVTDNYRASRVGAEILIEISEDGKDWEVFHRAENPYVYAWQEIENYTPAKFIRITSAGFNTTIGELGVYYQENIVNLKILDGNGEELLDEQNSVPSESTWENSTYFDEIYHARTAYEYILGAEPYENTHPTLGKLIISLGILIFGMCPLGWRLPGVIFGILMLPVFYRLLRRFFDSRFISFGLTFLFAFDFMHFTQTRIATIDTYAVFFILVMFNFMASFASKDIYKEKPSSLLFPLALSGLFMGLGIASKWTVAYAAVGLAIVYFIKLIKNDRAEGIKLINKRTVTLSLWCILFFLIIPFIIYFCSFLVCTLLPQNSYNIFERFFAYQMHMYDYHSKLVAEHYFASPWYEWPLVIRNIWYYGKKEIASTNMASTIVCLGNPVIWWAGLVSIIYLAFDIIRKKAKGMMIIIIAFLSCYLPWVFVSRLTFIYHYFTAVPFIIMAIGYVVLKLSENKYLSKPIYNKGVLQKISLAEFIFTVYLIASFILFIIFYPAISGEISDYGYLKSLEWLGDWYFI